MTTASDSHAGYFREESEQLLPVCEAIFSMIRKPLLDQIRDNRAFLFENVLSDPIFVLGVYGITVRDEERTKARAIAKLCRDRWIADLDRLAAALESGIKRELRLFIQSLVDAMSAAFAAGKTLGNVRFEGVEPKLHAVIDGDTAFRMNKYLLDLLGRVTANIPRAQSLIATRAR